MKELKPYLQRSLTTSGPLNLFLVNKRRKQETRAQAASNNFQLLTRNCPEWKEASNCYRERRRGLTLSFNFKFWLLSLSFVSSLTVYMFEWFSQQATLTFLHPYFALSKLKYSMLDRQKPFSEFQQTTAVETFDNFRYKSFLKSCLYSTWFMFIEFVFKLVSGSLFFFSCSRHQKHPKEALWIQVTGSAF